MLDFQALEEAFAGIKAVGHTQETVMVGGIPVILKTLQADEDMEAMSHAQEALEEAEENMVTITDYSDRYKIAILSYAIMGVGKETFNDGDLIDMGEGVGGGKTRKLTKHDALRVILSKWPRTMLIRLAQRYSELEHRSELRVEEALELNPADLNSEKDRLQDRIDELDKRQDRKSVLIDTPTAVQARKAADISPAPSPPQPDGQDEDYRHQVQQAQQAVQPPPAQRPPQAVSPPIPAQQVQHPLTPAAPVSGVPTHGYPNPAAASILPAGGPPPSRPATPRPPVEQDTGSLVDTSDPEGMQAAIQAENNRWIAARNGKAAELKRRRNAQAMVPAVPVRPRRAPHAAAAQVASDLQAVGTVEGSEAFSGGHQEVSAHTETSTPHQRTVTNDSRDEGSLNPNYRPRK